MCSLGSFCSLSTTQLLLIGASVLRAADDWLLDESGRGLLSGRSRRRRRAYVIGSSVGGGGVEGRGRRVRGGSGGESVLFYIDFFFDFENVKL